MFLFGHSGAYTTTVQGTASGQYHYVLLSHDNSVSITAAASRADTDQLTTAANLGGLRFGQSTGSGGGPASIELVGQGDGGELQRAALALAADGECDRVRVGRADPVMQARAST